MYVCTVITLCIEARTKQASLEAHGALIVHLHADGGPVSLGWVLHERERGLWSTDPDRAYVP